MTKPMRRSPIKIVGDATARWIAIIVASFVCQMTIPAPADAQANASKPGQLLKGTIWQNRVVSSLESIGAKCIIESGRKDSLVISDVRMGSKAFYKGLVAGDVVQGVEESDRTLRIRIERNNQTFQLEINKVEPAEQPIALGALKGTRDAARPVLDASVKNPPTLDVNPPKKPPKTDDECDKLLKDYEVELIIDASGSMNEDDGTSGLSKWLWCRKQVTNLGQRLDAIGKNVTLTTFNAAYQTRTHVPAKDIKYVFSSQPVGGTGLLAPLSDRLEQCLIEAKSANKGIVIGVLTDGMPNIPPNPSAINDALVTFSQKLTRPSEVTVVVFEIGKSFPGHAFCSDLADNLRNEGAKYNLVELVTFDELQSKGLANALAEKLFAHTEYANSYVWDVPTRK